MSLETATNYLKKHNLESRIILFKESTATVSEAAHMLNTDEDNIAKSMSFKVDNKPLLIILSGNSKVDNHKYKEYFKEKAHMLSHDEVELLIGHPVGGVCPFGINDDVKIYLDESLKRHDIVYPACGTPNSAVKLKLTELESILNNPTWIDVSKK